MADIEKFQEKVKLHCKERKVSQERLASKVGLSSSELSRRLNGKEVLTPLYVKLIVRALAEVQAITTREEANDLVRLMECDDFDQADWSSDSLKKLKLTSPPVPSSSNQQPQPSTFTVSTTRKMYLERVVQRNSFVTLPLGKSSNFPLQDIFQPLKLHKDSVMAEDLAYEERRALLDEPTKDEDDPRLAWSEFDASWFFKQKQKEPPTVIAKDGDEALEKSPQGRLVILGHPGAGKTTVLWKFFMKAAQRALSDTTSMIPLFISLPELVESGETFQHYLPILLGSLGIDDRYAQVLWQEIQRGHAFLCLDGLDEVSSKQREKVLVWINGQAAAQGNIWIIGSRFSEYRSGQLRQGQFSEWELQPLTPELRRELAQRLLPEMYRQLRGSRTSPKRLSSSFIKALENHERAVTWGKSPLLLSLAAIVFVDLGKLPASRAQLYRQVLDAVLKMRLKDSQRRTTVRIVAAALALKLQQQKRRTFTREMLFHLLGEICRSQAENWSTETIAQDIIHSGLLEVVAENIYGFWHQSYQEYLAATDLAHLFLSQEETTRTSAWNLAWEKRRYSQWIEILRLLVGVLVSESQRMGIPLALSWLRSLAALRIQPEGDVGDLGLALVIRSLGEVGETKTTWRNKEWVQFEREIASIWIQALLETIERKQDMRGKRLLALAEDVRHFSPPVVSDVVSKLTKDIANGSVPIYEVVLRTLGRLGTYTQVPSLISALDDQREEVRDAAAHALTELDGYAATRAIIRALKSHKILVREAAMKAVGEVQRYNLLRYLLPGLRDRDWRVQRAAVEALGNLGEEIPVNELVACLSDENETVRMTAVEALGKLGEKTPWSRLLPLLDDPEDSVRGAAIQILGEQTPVEKLVAEIDIPETQRLFSSAYRPALEILARLDEKVPFEKPTTGMDRENQRRHRAMQTTNLRQLLPIIREFQRETPTEQIIEALYDSNEDRSLSAAYVLGRRQEWVPLKQFVASLSDSSHGYLRTIAIQLLSRLGGKAPLHLFISALNDPYSQARLEAVRALEMQAEPLPNEAGTVVILLDDADRRIQAAALRIMIRTSEHIPFDLPLLEKVLKALQSEYTSVARPARLFLERTGRRVTRDQYATLFRHENVRIRMDAIKTLGPSASPDQLFYALKDEHAEVRAVAMQALKRSGEQLPLPILTEALKDEEPGVYYTAIDILKKRGEWQILNDIYDEDGLLTLPQRRARRDQELLEEIEYSEVQPQMRENIVYSLITRRDDAPRDSSQERKMADEMLEVHAEVMREHYSHNQLIDKLEDERGEERRDAIYALGEDAPERKLLFMLTDEDGQVRRAALRVLGERTPTEQLQLALGDKDESVREEALQRIKNMGDRFPKALLFEVLEHKNSLMRASALRALAEHVPVEKLIATLGESEEEVRLAAFNALLETHPETIPMIVVDLSRVATGEGASEILASTGKYLVAEAVEYLEYAPRFLVDEVAKLLDWHYWEVRMRAAQALGKLRRNISEQAVLRLLALRNDDRESQLVREAADDALAEILSLEDGLEER